MPPEFPIRLAVMISLVITLGGLGFIFIASFYESTTPLLLVEYFGLAMTTGPALVISLVGALTLLNIPLTEFSLSTAFLTSCGVSILGFLIKKPKIRIKRSFFPYQDLAENILPLSLFFALLILRLVQLRDIFVPTGYDGIFHTALLQEAAEGSDLSSYSIFQIGFPAVSLVIHSLWNLSPAETILLTTQWLGAVCGLSFYIFARRYIRNVYAAGLSFVVYAFLLLFPSALAVWGQYSFLLGLMLLPPAILTSMDWANHRSSIWPALLLVLSLAFTHIESLLIWSSFVVVYVLHRIVLRKSIRVETLSDSKEVFLRLLLVVSPVVMVALPMTFAPFRNYLLQQSVVSPLAKTDLEFSISYLLRLLRLHDSFFIFLGIGWILWSLVWSRKLLFVTVFWPLAIFFFIWLQDGLTKSSIFTYTDLILFLCLPLALSIGLLARQGFTLLMRMDALDHRPLSRRLVKGRLSILLLIGTVMGIASSPLSMDQRRILFTGDDMLAMQWISASTPSDSGFLIRNTTLNSNILVPSDGGGWIPLLTGRRTIIPQTGELSDICGFAADHGASYMYFGRQTGDEGFDLRLSDLDEATYEVVYGSQSVEIAALRCP